MVMGAQQDPATDPQHRLLAAAGPVFAQKGFHQATLRDIAAVAEVNVAAVSYYFGDKMGLYREVIRQVRESRERRFPVPNTVGTENPQLALWRLIHTMLSRMLHCDEGNWETQLLLREMENPTAVFDDLVNDCFRPLFGQLTGIIEKLVSPTSHVSCDTIEQLALSAVGQCLYYRVGRRVVDVLIPVDRRQANFDVHSLSRHITSVILCATDSNRFLETQTALQSLIDDSISDSTSKTQ